MNYRVTISMPCWGRPLRTKRAIECIMAQDINGWEALIGGDNCPDFQKLIDSGWLEDKAQEAKSKGNIIKYYQWPTHEGGCGYKITNNNIKEASGKYLVFYANDDIITPDHLSNYLEIENHKNLNMMYFDSFVEPSGSIRVPKLGYCQIGHSEIIVKTSIARSCREHTNKYGHDWDFIYDIIKKGRHMKSTSKKHTYHIMNVPSIGCSDIID